MNNDDRVRFTHHKPPYHAPVKCGAMHTPTQPEDRGLLQYRKWWELACVDIAVNGEVISGMPIFVKDNTLRVINSCHSYFIPLEKIDYIRTTDGLCAQDSSSADSAD